MVPESKLKAIYDFLVVRNHAVVNICHFYSTGFRKVSNILNDLQRNRLRWYGHVLRKEDNDWVKKCMEYEVEGAKPRGRPKKTWREIVKQETQLKLAVADRTKPEVEIWRRPKKSTF